MQSMTAVADVAGREQALYGQQRDAVCDDQRCLDDSR